VQVLQLIRYSCRLQRKVEFSLLSVGLRLGRVVVVGGNVVVDYSPQLPIRTQKRCTIKTSDGLNTGNLALLKVEYLI